jgi:PAS domain-containing protein
VEVLVPERFRAGHPGRRQGYLGDQRVRLMGGPGADLFGLRKDRSEFQVEISLGPLETPQGTLLSALVRDVTDRKAAEIRLDELEQQRHIALRLQRSLMGSPSPVDGITTASRYFPAGQGAGVGGDWFDLIALDDGQVGIIIGDVMGRGLEAAVVMGQLRSAAHALAKTGMSPRQLMETLDAVVSELPDQLVTCCYLVLDPKLARLTVCSAGHLPTLLVEPGGRAYPLAVPVSVPLGVGGIPHQQTTVMVPPGSILAMCTDGLVEGPRSDIEERLNALSRTLEIATTSCLDLERGIDLVLETMLPDTTDYPDDVTLLLFRVPNIAVSLLSVDHPTEMHERSHVVTLPIATLPTTQTPITMGRGSV